MRTVTVNPVIHPVIHPDDATHVETPVETPVGTAKSSPILGVEQIPIEDVQVVIGVGDAPFRKYLQWVADGEHGFISLENARWIYRMHKFCNHKKGNKHYSRQNFLRLKVAGKIEQILKMLGYWKTYWD